MSCHEEIRIRTGDVLGFDHDVFQLILQEMGGESIVDIENGVIGVESNGEYQVNIHIRSLPKKRGGRKVKRRKEENETKIDILGDINVPRPV